MRRLQFHKTNRKICGSVPGNSHAFVTRENARSEAPALRVADEEVAERLNARDRLQLFRVDEERVERRAFLFAEQLNQADVFLDQVVGQ